MPSSVPGAQIRLSAYPALLLFAGLASGIWIAETLDEQGIGIWAALILVAGGTAVVSARLSAGKLVSLVRLSRYAAAAALAISAGGVRAVQFNSPSKADVVFLLSDERERAVTLFGRTLGTPVEKNGRARFVLAADSLTVATGGAAVRTAGRVYVSVRRAEPLNWLDGARAGSHVAVSGTLHEPHAPRNPADFDFKRYLLHRSIRSILQLDEASGISAIGPTTRPIGRIVVAVERSVEGALNRYIPTEDGRGILFALLLGRRSEMDPQVLDQFSRTGLLHILAVSGLHVLMVGMIMYGLLCPILLRFGLSWRAMEISRAALTMLLLTVYAIVTGGSASVTRAVVMTGVLIGGVALQRSAPSLNSLALAGCILLLQRPTYLWDVGFQLSFTAVAAIVLLQRPLLHFMPERWPEESWQMKLAQGAATTAAATLGTAPVLLYHFGRVSVAGLLLNPLAIPASGLALSSGLLTVLTSGIPLLAAGFGQSADIFSHVLIRTASVGDSLFGWARIDARLTYPPYVIGLILATGIPAVLHAPRIRWRLCIASAGFVVLGAWANALIGNARPTMDVVFLDVGQGDAAFLRFPNGKRMLVDLGPRDRYRDAGADVIVPHLDWAGIQGLHTVLVTHPHADHLGGLPTVLRHKSVDRLIHNGDAYTSELYDEFRELRDSLGIDETIVGAGDTVQIDPRVRLYVLAPTAASVGNTNPNERSVVLRVVFGSTSILLAGDAERAAENELLTHYRNELQADVVKVGHHGSETSSQERFVRAVLPPGERAIAVVSVAKRNRFGLPDEVTLSRWRRAGADVHLTARDGALWIRSDGRNVERVHWRDH